MIGGAGSGRRRLPRSSRSWVRAPDSTPIPTSSGFTATCVAQLIVMRLRRPPARVPRTYKPDGHGPQHAATEPVVAVGVLSRRARDRRRRPAPSWRAHDEPGPVAFRASRRASAFTYPDAAVASSAAERASKAWLPPAPDRQCRPADAAAAYAAGQEFGEGVVGRGKVLIGAEGVVHEHVAVGAHAGRVVPGLDDGDPTGVTAQGAEARRRAPSTWPRNAPADRAWCRGTGSHTMPAPRRPPNRTAPRPLTGRPDHGDPPGATPGRADAGRGHNVPPRRSRRWRPPQPAARRRQRRKPRLLG